MYAGTCVKNGRHGNMPRDVLYVLPCLEEPPANIMVRRWVTKCFGERCGGLFVNNLYTKKMKKNLLDGLQRSVIVVETLQACNYIFCVRKIIHTGNHILGNVFTNVLRNQGLLTMQLRKEVPGIAPTKSQPVEGGHTLHNYAKFHFR